MEHDDTCENFTKNFRLKSEQNKDQHINGISIPLTESAAFTDTVLMLSGKNNHTFSLVEFSK